MNKLTRLLNFQTERQVVDFDKDCDQFFSMISLTAPEMDEKSLDKRKPIDLALVVDVSGSMSGEKIELTKKTLLFLIQEMQETDRVSIILFDSYIDILQELTVCTPVNKVEMTKKVEKITDRGSTNLSGGLVCGLNILSERLEKDKISSCLLFTDGEANCGVQNNLEILQLINGEKEHPVILTHQTSITRQYLQKKNQNGMKIPSKNYVSEGLTIYTFGFGARHSGELLKSISEAGNGMYYFIASNEAIADSFVDCLGGLMSIVCKNIELVLTPESGVEITKVHTVYKTRREENRVHVNIKDLQSEETRDILLEMKLPKVESSGTKQRILRCSLEYKDQEDQKQKEEILGVIMRSEEEEEEEPLEEEEEEEEEGEGEEGEEKKNKKKKKKRRKRKIMNEKIDEQRNRVMVSERIIVAQKLADQRKYADAKKVYEQAITDVEGSSSAKTPLSIALVKDLKEQVKLMNSKSYETSGTSQQISSFSQSLSYQRTSSHSYTSGTYSISSKKKSMASRKTSYFN